MVNESANADQYRRQPFLRSSCNETVLILLMSTKTMHLLGTTEAEGCNVAIFEPLHDNRLRGFSSCSFSTDARTGDDKPVNPTI